ncbi:hypothetical protein [Variovorax sp. PAMC 28711]|uniref:hypothetical protein n=1 Tax=Variovorax sp. PAMC 28711 TaxID=1795631 RepID=UPI00078B446C|nr:hypothetical protein [Variovorax sp. PAMC 28711]AMM26066.1 hypothetical protein AX767_18185 [Variovorax sp. PAMC 28711]
MARQPLKLRLGNEWQMFAQPHADYRLLGTVQDGMQIGALAQTQSGGYVQLNGDVVRELNTSRVEHALDRVTGASRDGFRGVVAAPVAPTQTTVVIKKRRRIPTPV